MKSARKQARKYRRKGAFGSTKKLVRLLDFQSKQFDTLLEVGGGIGAVQLAFLESGGSRVTSVDASSAYLTISEDLLKEKGFSEQLEQFHGDLVDHDESIEKHDLVFLDKVICCYPDYQALLGSALNHCERRIALSFPMGGLVGKVVNGVASLYVKWFTDNPFRPYLHPKEEVDLFIRAQGFIPIVKTTSFPWRQWIYEKQ